MTTISPKTSLSITLLTMIVVLAVEQPVKGQVAGRENQGDWWAWRGPNANGIADEQPMPPIEFSPTEGVLWKAPVPGRGHSSPIVVGDLVLLTTADEQTQVQSVVAYNRNTGSPAWKRDLHEGNFAPKIHPKNTHASPTLASDGKQLYAVFNNDRGVQATALTLDGKVVWEQRVGDYSPEKYKFGYAPSPVLYQDLMIIAADFESGYIAGLHTEDGRTIWKTSRPSQISFSSPIVGRTAGRDQLLLSGAAQVASYNPATGKQLWSAAVTAPATCGTLVWSDKMVFASGGYPKRETAAVMSDGSGKVVWRNQEKCYEQSMLYHDGYLYAINDNGIAICWEAATGEPQWKQRLPGGPVSASPTLVGDTIYSANEAGTIYVFKADPREFTLIANNQMGDEAFASPVICGGRIFLRTASQASGTRQETLYCVGNER